LFHVKRPSDPNTFHVKRGPAGPALRNPDMATRNPESPTRVDQAGSDSRHQGPPHLFT